MKEDPPKPTGPITPAQIAESGLHWVLCGGLQVGGYTQPKVWRLRPKNEHFREAQRAADLQKMAAMARLLSRVLTWCETEDPKFEIDADAIRRVLNATTANSERL